MGTSQGMTGTIPQGQISEKGSVGGKRGGREGSIPSHQQTWADTGWRMPWHRGLGLLTRRSPTASGAAPLSRGLELGLHLAWFSVTNPQRGLWLAEEQRVAVLAPGPGEVWEAGVGGPRASGLAPAWPQQPWHLIGAGAMFGSSMGRLRGGPTAAGGWCGCPGAPGQRGWAWRGQTGWAEICEEHRSQNWTGGGWVQKLAPGKLEEPQKAQLVWSPWAGQGVLPAQMGQKG